MAQLHDGDIYQLAETLAKTIEVDPTLTYHPTADGVTLQNRVEQLLKDAVKANHDYSEGHSIANLADEAVVALRSGERGKGINYLELALARAKRWDAWCNNRRVGDPHYPPEQ